MVAMINTQNLRHCSYCKVENLDLLILIAYQLLISPRASLKNMQPIAGDKQRHFGLTVSAVIDGQPCRLLLIV